MPRKPPDSQQLLTTADAARELGVTVRRVQQMVSRCQLTARLVGRDWLIDRADLEAVRVRPKGRPKSKRFAT